MEFIGFPHNLVILPDITETIPLVSNFFPLYGSTQFELNITSEAALIEQITSALENIIELSSVVWDQQRFYWKIEYGTKPLELSVPFQCYHTVKSGKWNAMIAASEAVRRFPALIENDFDMDNIPRVVEVRQWHKSEIYLYFNPVSLKYLIYFNRLTGSRASFYYTWVRILTQICEMNGLEIPEEFQGMVANYMDEEI